MTHQEILTKTIEKAVANGWTGHKDLTYELPPPKVGYWPVIGFIFDHGFAKALWGDRVDRCKLCGCDTISAGKQYIPGEPDEWYANCKECGAEATEDTRISAQYYHLQQMVIAEDPIEYLGRHI